MSAALAPDWRRNKQKRVGAYSDMLTNRVCRQHWGKRKKKPGDLLPSPWLDVEVQEDQRDLLNPGMQDLLLCTVEEEAYGEGAKKKRALRRQDMIDGNAKSYARVLNSDDRMESLIDFNGLAAVVSEMRREKDEKRAETAAKKKQEDKKKQKKKAAEEERIQKEKEELLPGLKEDVEKGQQYILSLKVARLRQILLYVFDLPRAEVNKLNKEPLQKLVLEKIRGDTII